MAERYIRCGKEGELEIDLESAEVRLRRQPPLEKLERAEFNALVILVSAHGKKCTYSQLLPDSVAGDRDNRAQNVISQLNKKLYGWLRPYLTTVANVPQVVGGGYLFGGPVIPSDKPAIEDENRVAVPDLSLTASAPSPMQMFPGTMYATKQKSFLSATLNRDAVPVVLFAAAMLLLAVFVHEGAFTHHVVRAPSGSVAQLVQAEPTTVQSLVVANLVPSSRNSVSAVRLEGSLLINGIEDETMRRVVGLTLEFEPLRYGDHLWQLTRGIDEPLLVRNFNSFAQRDIYWSRHPKSSAWYFALKADGKQYHLIDLPFTLRKDGAPCRCSHLDTQFMYALTGIPADSKGNRAHVPIRAVVKLDDGKLLRADVQTWLAGDPDIPATVIW